MSSTLCFSFACLLLLGQAAAAELSSSYEWKPMKIGGGGWLVGLSINSAEKDLLYARADVSGAYRWNPATSAWKQVVTASSMPPEYVGYGKYSGVDSIVSAPSDANVAYMTMGAEPYAASAGQVFRSTNRGDTWTATQFHKTGVKMEANGEGRQDGERLAVDPANSNVVYYASIKEGLWFTDNAGASWTKVAAIPAGKPPHGVTTVVFDPSSKAARRTQVFYISVIECGVFQTQDAGESWTKISDGAAGDAGRPRDATIGKDGTCYIVYDGENGAGGASFAKVGNPRENCWNAILKATPGHAKDLWFAAGPARACATPPMVAILGPRPPASTTS
ncbi:MAG: hypothetical protein B7Z37_19585 [Verrucomicrobia bacterium 12-59-8]|nr:MAG: hypothetical protein B7Z37_19585 [Verrucomicrobia bacterium 12-59-8]